MMKNLLVIITAYICDLAQTCVTVPNFVAQCRMVCAQLIDCLIKQVLTSHLTQFWRRCFTGLMTQPTVS